MRYKITLIIIIFSIFKVSAQNTAITVGGDYNKFYPVLFKDKAWHNNKATIIEIGRSDVHMDTSWRGALIAKFSFHLTHWGHGSHFIDADIKHGVVPFIASWLDASTNSTDGLLIWLRGGNTTYFLHSNVVLEYTIFDNVQQNLPYQETNGPAHSYKTEVDPMVNHYGPTLSSVVYWNNTGTHYMNGSLGIGTKNTVAGERLAVNGNIRAKEIKVEVSNWPDYVFKEDYMLTDIMDLKQYIKQFGHLPQIPSAEQVHKEGIQLGELNKELLKKIEELTLYIIQQKEESIKQQKEIEALKKVVFK